MSANGGAVGISATSAVVEQSTIKYIEKDPKSLAEDASSNEEQGEIIDDSNDDEEINFLSHEEQFPIDPNEQLETQQFTFRAVFVGSLLGGVIAASKWVYHSPPLEQMLTISQCLPRPENWLDFWRCSIRLHLWLCDPQTPFEGASRAFRRGLFRTKGERLLSICCHGGWFFRAAVHFWVSCGISTWFAWQISQR